MGEYPRCALLLRRAYPQSRLHTLLRQPPTERNTTKRKCFWLGYGPKPPRRARAASGVPPLFGNMPYRNPLPPGRNFAPTGDRLEAMKAIIDQFRERG